MGDPLFPHGQSFGDAGQQARELTDRLYREHYKEIRNYVHKKIDIKDAEDVTQECFKRAFEHFLSKENNVKHEIQWLYGIARHCISDYYAKKNALDTQVVSLENVQSQGIEPYFALEDVENEVECREKLRQTTGAIEALSPRKREVMELLMQGYTEQEIAQKLGLSDGAIRAYVTHARKAIKGTIQ